MPSYDYDVAVIGAGSAGLTASGFAAALGAKTLLVEHDRTGGDCTWGGCIPSKALVRAAAAAHAVRGAGRFGIDTSGVTIDFARVMHEVRATRQSIYDTADSPERIRSRNIDLVSAHAAFADDHTLVLTAADEQSATITARYFIICAGSRPILPHVPGLPLDRLFTTNTVFELSEQPGRLLVMGGGPTGVELAQAFARLGSNVAIVEREPEILQAEEPELAARVRANLMAEGVAMHLGCSFDSVSHDAGQYSALLASGERWSSARFDAVLAAIGRAPNVEGMRLEAAGVRYSEHGVTINHSCQTTASHIYACGDVTGAPRFSHVAEDMARTAVMRLLLKVPAAYERRCVPWVTFTDPECGHLGQTAEQLRAANTRFETIRFPYSRLDRSLVDQASDGLILVHVSPVSGKILGAHVHGACAGELVNEFALAMRNDLSLRDIAGTVHAYPTYTLGVRRVADQWYVRSGSPRLVEMVRGLFGYRGRASEQFGGDEVV